MEKKEQVVDFSLLDFTKKNWAWILLALILVFGFYLRAYHLDYPVVGYHNWKETHYLTEARNFAKDGFFEHGVFVPAWDYPSLDADPSGAHGDTFPTTSIITGFFFMILGPKLWVARLISILFALGCVFFIYLIVRKLFKREDLALLTALIASTNPLLVFFGRQVQLINPSLFFTLFGVYYFLKWKEDQTIKNMLVFSITFTLGVITKYPQLLMAIPIAFIFPYKKLLDKKLWKQYFVSIIVFLLIPVWIFYSKYVSGKISGRDVNIQAVSVDPFIVFTSNFWQIMKNFLADNFTLIGVFFAFLGLIALIIFYKRKNQGNRFFMGYFLGSILWFFIMAEKLNGHNYHQYPLIFLVCFLIAYSFVVISANLEKIIKFKYSKLFFIALLFLLLIFPPFFSGGGIFKAKNRMFDTQFIGLDLAGEYIREHSQTEERLFFPGHQSYGVLWHSDRKGYDTPDNLSQIKLGEEKGVNWIFVYNWGLSILKNEEVWDYIQSSYSLKQMAFLQTQQGNTPLYLLLEKGGSFNASEINTILNNQQIMSREYELTRGTNILYYANIEQ